MYLETFGSTVLAVPLVYFGSTWLSCACQYMVGYIVHAGTSWQSGEVPWWARGQSEIWIRAPFLLCDIWAPCVCLEFPQRSADLLQRVTHSPINILFIIKTSFMWIWLKNIVDHLLSDKSSIESSSTWCVCKCTKQEFRYNNAEVVLLGSHLHCV